MAIRVLLWREALAGVVNTSHESLELGSRETFKLKFVDMVLSEHGASCSVHKEPAVVKMKNPPATRWLVGALSPLSKLEAPKEDLSGVGAPGSGCYPQCRWQ